MKKVILIILLSVTARLNAQTAEVITSDNSGWHEIGSKNVDFSRDRDELLVLGANRFSSIKVFVKGAPIELIDLEVYFANGDKQVMQVRNKIEANGETKPLDLRGRESDVKKILFVYKTRPNQKDQKAKVEIWGMKTNAVPNKSAVEMPGIVLSDKKGWHKIGERTINWKMDHDEIVVIGADRFSALKLKAEFGSIDLRGIDVVYESGDNQKIQIQNPIKAGTETRVIDLNGGERSLKKIVFVYKTIPDQSEEKALVEVWGLKTNKE